LDPVVDTNRDLVVPEFMDVYYRWGFGEKPLQQRREVLEDLDRFFDIVLVC
jgi:hypothetical protein